MPGDTIAEFAVFALTLTVAGQAPYAEYISDYLLAIGFGIVFQYLVISCMQRLTLLVGSGRRGQVRRHRA